MRTQKYILFFLLPLCMVACITMDVPMTKTPVIKKGDIIPGLVFSAPHSKADRDYLGIGEKKTFLIADVAADVLLVEVMNINCGSCQQQAPINNNLYSLIESIPEAAGRIKMMAVSAGTVYRHILDFREHFETPYPVIEDPDFAFYDAIGRTPTPFTIALIRDEGGRLSLVADTQKGTHSNYQETLKRLQSLLDEESSVIRRAGQHIEDTWIIATPVLSEEELRHRIETAFKEEGEGFTDFTAVQLQSFGTVYTGLVNQGDQEKRLFAMPVSRPLPCDLCHDAHFIYLFDASGMILSFLPVQLSKYENKRLDEKDIEQLRKRIVGRYLYKRFDYDLTVDAVSAATITSAVVYNSIRDGNALYHDLVRQGLIAKDNR